MKKKLLILTDTTSKQINGVTRSLDNLKSRLPKHIELYIISTEDFWSIPFFGYKEIQLSFSFPPKIWKKIAKIQPDFVHIVTEWPIGLSAALMCQKHDIPYTTSFHTKYPEYLNMRSRLIRTSYVHKYLHYIHNFAERIFISNAGMIPYIERHWYGSYAIVPLGIDHEQFFPWEAKFFKNDNRKKILFVGRLAIEKNIEDFLEISDKYLKIVVGDGPEFKNLQKNYPNALFLGVKKWDELADIYRSVDAFVFPSKTDTLGLVNLEALACGKPVLAYNIENMRGIIQSWYNGILVNENLCLETGLDRIFSISSENCIASTEFFNWDNYARQFISHQVQIDKNLWN